MLLLFSWAVLATSLKDELFFSNHISIIQDSCLKNAYSSVSFRLFNLFSI